MANLPVLKKRAKAASKLRGHKLGLWRVFPGKSRTICNAKCEVCGAEVQCNDHPLPNEIEIGGTAVALNCPI